VIPPVQEDQIVPSPLSLDIRSRFRVLYEAGMSGRAAACQLLISASSASRLARKIKRGDSLDPAPNRRATGRGKLGPYSDFLTELVTQDPDITLEELRESLEHAHDVRASVSGVDQALKRLGYSYKKRASSRMNADVRT
jgi:transposase